MHRFFNSLFAAAAVIAALSFSSSLTAADKPGQADLDQATDLQITAETLGELEKVVKLAESALEKGLDKEQQDFAKKLLAATLYQHANRSVESLIERGRRNPRLASIRTQALKDLDKAKKFDPALPDVYLLEAKLQAFPGGDLKAAAAQLSGLTGTKKGQSDAPSLGNEGERFQIVK